MVDCIAPLGRHAMQFYEDPAALVERASAYLAEGARRGEGLVVIAVPSRRSAFADRLAAWGVDVPLLRADGRLLELDAEETLSALLLRGRPDPALFEDLVGRRVREAAGRAGDAGVCAYGEMVDLLWTSFRTEAAVALEELWNRLLRIERLRLFCAYAVDGLAPGMSTGAIQAVLAAHSHLEPTGGGGRLAKAVEEAMREALGGETLEALQPLIRATQHAVPVEPGPEAALLWLRNHLPALAAAVLSRSRDRFDAGEP